MSETRQARNLVFYALAAYVLVLYLEARLRLAAPGPATHEAPTATDVIESFGLQLFLKAQQSVDFVTTLLMIIGYPFKWIGGAFHLFPSAGCG
jgi:hypothetical protein